MEDSSVIIVGAGAAGLAAARDLSVAGHQAIVLEARDRIGGRIFTWKSSEFPLPIELGAEFVHGKSPALWDLAGRAHLELNETSDSHWYFEDGKLSKSHDFWKHIEELNDRMKSCASDQSLKDFLSTLPDDDDTRRAKDMVTRYVQGFHAADIDRIGIHGIVKANEAADDIEGDKSFRFMTGYDSLINALCAESESYGAKIHLNTIVREIGWSNQRIEVVCEHDNRLISFAAAVAIITLPLGVLQKNDENPAVRFIPELPAHTRRAIKTLVMGNVLRIVLCFRERFWEAAKAWDQHGTLISFRDTGFIHYPDAPIPTWWTQLPLRAPVLVGWTGGPRADILIDRENFEPQSGTPATIDANILDRAIESLARIFNLSKARVRDQLEASYHHEWGQDPFSRGAYSYVPVNGLAHQRELSQPIADRLFFAGEATSVGHIGTVHGAIQSGQRAAREVADCYNG
jgi:monoamine oxidase